MTGSNQVNAMYVASNGTISNGLGITSGTPNNLVYSGTSWGFWRDYYYPQVIRESYPVYIQERAKDNGKQAFEVIKALQDKKLIKLEKVSDFIEAMDTLIKLL